MPKKKGRKKELQSSPAPAAVREAFGAEKRLYVRKRLRTRVVFEDESGEGFIYFYSTDVSLGGIFLESDIPLKIGTRIFLSFSLGEGETSIRATGQVVRVERDPTDILPILGMGVQFMDLPEGTRQAIDHYVNNA